MKDPQSGGGLMGVLYRDILMNCEHGTSWFKACAACDRDEFWKHRDGCIAGPLHRVPIDCYTQEQVDKDKAHVEAGPRPCDRCGRPGKSPYFGIAERYEWRCGDGEYEGKCLVDNVEYAQERLDEALKALGGK